MTTHCKPATQEKTAAQSPKTKVLLVEDHQVLLEAMVRLFDSVEEIEIAATATTAEDALLETLGDFDLVILDLTLPDHDGFWLIRKIKKSNPRLPILALTMHDEPIFVIQALEAGVDGYLTKWAGQEELFRAIESVLRDGSYLQARIAPLVVDALRRGEHRRVEAFTQRETQLAKYLVDGLSNPQIAKQLGLSVSTVKARLRSLFAKLGVSSRTEAAVVVVEKHILR